MQFNSKTGKLTLTKREQQTLADAVRIVNDAARILGDQILDDTGDAMQTAVEKLVPKE